MLLTGSWSDKAHVCSVGCLLRHAAYATGNGHLHAGFATRVINYDTYATLIRPSEFTR